MYTVFAISLEVLNENQKTIASQGRLGVSLSDFACDCNCYSLITKSGAHTLEPTKVKPQTAAEATGKDTSRELFPEGDAMDRFVSVFESSARRWELVIYPAMMAFVVLAGYGFFLIYTLSKDIRTMAQGMDPEMGKNLSHISESVIYLSENVRTMTRRVYHMSESVETMADRMVSLEHLEPMLNNMQGMNQSIGAMNRNMSSMNMSIDAMRYDMGEMSHSMRPMGEMNNFMP